MALRPILFVEEVTITVVNNLEQYSLLGGIPPRTPRERVADKMIFREIWNRSTLHISR